MFKKHFPILEKLMKKRKVKISIKKIKLGLRYKKCIFLIHYIINFLKSSILLKTNNKEEKKMGKIKF